MERVERTAVDLSNGGVVTVILGPGGDLPTEFGFHPKVRPVDGRIIDYRDPSQRIPANTKAVVFGGGTKLDRKIFEAVHEWLKKRKTVYVITRNDEHLRQTLRDMVPEDKPQVEPVIEPDVPAEPQTPEQQEAAEQKRAQAGRGAIKKLLEQHMPTLLQQDATMPVAEAARQLFRLAQDAGISTTMGSLQQAVRVYKKDHRIGERPTSIQSAEQRAYTGIDDAIMAAESMVAALKRAREHFAAREAEHVKTAQNLKNLKEILGAFKEEAGL